MDLKFTGKFKSINNFEWDNIPEFSVITGPNGVGKSQLLALLNQSISSNRNQNSNLIKITGENFDKNEVRYVTSEWQIGGSPNISLKTLQDKRQKLYQEFRSKNRREKNPIKESIFNEISREIGKSVDEISKEEFLEFLPENLLTNHTHVPQEIGELFYNYRINYLEKIADGMPENAFKQKFGSKPWVILDDILKESNLPFKFTNPEESSIRDNYVLNLLDTESGDIINLNDLSSGEKVIISLVFYLYNSQENQFFPKLLLLDEPDAHLHPSMTKQFLDVVHNVLVKKYSVRVIMTTHSPSTIALSPEESIFEMFRTGKRIRKSSSKNKSISLLTSGLVVVGRGTKYVLVEDDDDVKFYNYIAEKLIKDELINADIPIVFIPASSESKSGGKTVVKNWVEKLKSSGLEEIIQGLVDKDSDSNQPNSLRILKRYSIENYLIDPINIYAFLLDLEKTPKINGIELGIGDEYKLKSMNAKKLQRVADKILSEVEKNLQNIFADFKESEKKRVQINFANGKKLNYPTWVLNRRGKDLLNLYRSSISNGINMNSLLKTWKKIQLIPDDLVVLMKSIQKN